MNRLFLIVCVLGLLEAWPAAAVDEPAKRKFGDVIAVPAGEVVDGDYFAVGRVVEISGTVNGDVYAVGGDVLVDGVVNGDLLASGGNVAVSGTIVQDARIIGGQITVSGTIGRNATIAGGAVNVTLSAAVKGAQRCNSLGGR